AGRAARDRPRCRDAERPTDAPEPGESTGGGIDRPRATAGPTPATARQRIPAAPARGACRGTWNAGSSASAAFQVKQQPNTLCYPATQRSNAHAARHPESLQRELAPIARQEKIFEAPRIGLGIFLTAAGIALRAGGHPVVMMPELVNEDVNQLKRPRCVFS